MRVVLLCLGALAFLRAPADRFRNMRRRSKGQLMLSYSYRNVLTLVRKCRNMES